MIEKEDKAELTEYFDGRYVLKEVCNVEMSELKEKVANDSTELALIKQKLDTITWVSKTTLGAVIIAIVGAVMALILR